MSPLLDLQRRMRELGRIRTGVQVPTKGGKRRPERLETFRLTSASRPLLEAAAAVYGGRVEPWPEQGEFQLTTTVDALDIVIPPGETSFSQWYELWAAGGCQRRCDGRWNLIADEACACPADPAERRDLAADGRACKPTTRLNVILPAIPDLGVWRLESHGYYAAVELAGTAEFLERATASGKLLPARLRLDRREVKRPGEPTKQFAVPVIELPQTRMAEFLGVAELPAGLAPNEAVAQLPAGAPAGNGQRPSTRRQRVERPASAPSPALPAEAHFEKPQVPAAQAPEIVGGWAVEEVPPADDRDADLRALLLDTADARPLEEHTAPATEEQRVALKALLVPLGLPAVATVLRSLWGLNELRQIRAGQAAAILAAGSDPAFLERWGALLAEIDAAPAAELSFTA